jgi:tetratricopeptide (TPR) repeat protein
MAAFPRKGLALGALFCLDVCLAAAAQDPGPEALPPASTGGVAWVVLVTILLTAGLAFAWAMLFRGGARALLARDAAGTPLGRKADPQALSAARRGAGLLREHQYEPAAAAYREALRLDPDIPEAWAGLALLFEQQGRHEEASAAYREVARLKPDDAVAWYNLGVVHRKLGQHARATFAYREAIRLDAKMAEAWHGLGLAHAGQGQRDDAIAAQRQAVQIRADFAAAWLSLASLYEHAEEDAEAVAAYREALRARPDHAGAWYNLAVLYRERGQLEDATAAFLEAIRRRPRDTDAWYGLGMAYSLEGYREGVLEVYQQLAIINDAAAEEFADRYVEPQKGGGDASRAYAPPHLARAWYDLGLMYRDQNQQAQAVSSLEEAVRFDPTYAKAWYALGSLHWRRRRHEEALRCFREVVRLRPHLTAAWHRLGLLYAEIKQHDKACKAFLRAVRQNPRHVHAWCGVGMTRAKLGDAAGVAEVHHVLEDLDTRVAGAFFDRFVTGPEAPGGPRPPLPVSAARQGGGALVPGEWRGDPSLSFARWLRSLPGRIAPV